MNRRLLVIDDNPGDIELIKEMIIDNDLKYDVFAANSAEQALDELGQVNPDVIMVDTLMPGIGGLEFCHTLKKEMSLNTQIIVMTGSLDAVNEARAKKAGADAYCVKLAESILEALLKVHQTLDKIHG